MPVWLSIILEIVKITIPALIVFFTVQQVLKQYFANQEQMQLLKMQASKQENAVPLRFQAYERLSLFCERIELGSMLLRLRQEDANAAQMRILLMAAIQQEYEHNITQQVYVSDQLWKIIQFAKDDAIQVVTKAAEAVDPRADSRQLANAIISITNQRQGSAADKALVAIKKEASILFG